MADALRSRPCDEDDWSALRSAIESFVVPIYTLNAAGAQDLSRLALFTWALSGAHIDLADWRAPLTRAQPMPLRHPAAPEPAKSKTGVRQRSQELRGRPASDCRDVVSTDAWLTDVGRLRGRCAPSAVLRTATAAARSGSACR
jgi:hypothetical protein